MKKRNLLLFMLLFISFTMVKAQNKEMFIEQISGKTMVRENFESGKLVGKQVFTAEKMEQKGERFYLTIKTKIYDEEQKLSSVYSTTYQCNPNDANVLLSVFTFNPKDKKISVSAKSSDFKRLYDLDANKMLRSLDLTLYIETGLLNFLGSKNSVSIYNRSLSKNAQGWMIAENIRIKAYLLGIKIKTIDYKVMEYLTKDGLLRKQVFKQSNGDYFTIAYN
ncbi:MAG: hypothetical protein KKE39_00985 [Bacteroidetes bacterium]|nr:hypothetical protein [Bacteroidota bacterium]MBU1372670.1 hypothetical protein [Bacteroidota bacterium]MBU1484866.1 hypothetical protein [Bacteroidota bacterium]MBU1761569.1 hypothetical protein [Bacteroidota bacterium]MBU2266534.1 hypothetical protein [Bacteroidota bacterium]